MTMDELHVILSAYEMRNKEEKSSRKESTFKASNNTKRSKQESSKSSFDEFDDEE